MFHCYRYRPKLLVRSHGIFLQPFVPIRSAESLISHFNSKAAIEPVAPLLTPETIQVVFRGSVVVLVVTGHCSTTHALIAWPVNSTMLNNGQVRANVLKLLSSSAANPVICFTVEVRDTIIHRHTVVL